MTTPAVPAAEWIDGSTGCPRCGHFPASFVNISGTTVLCPRCEWEFTLSAQAPAGTTNGAVAAGATALPVASGGTSFTAGMVLLVGTGSAAEVIAAGSGATGTSVPVPGRYSPALGAYQGLAQPHASGTGFGQLAITGVYGTLVGAAEVPNPPGWGY